MKRVVPRLAMAAVALAIAAAVPRSSAQLPVRRTLALPPLDVVVPGSILLHARDGSAMDGTRPPFGGSAIPALPGAHRVATLGDGTERWDLDAPTSAAATAKLRDEFAAEHPELDVDVDVYRAAHAVTPNDEGYPKQWPLKLLNAPNAWAVTTGDPHLTVAVVDTGYTNHPDLIDKIVTGYDFITDPSNAGDGDGRDGDAHDAGDESEESSSFHGSHVSGIIGASSNNSIGMAGVDWSCRIQPVRVLGVKNHRGKDSDIADGIRWAAGFNVPNVPQNKTPARVINLSFGGRGYSRLLQDAITAARSRGVMVVASAGNDSSDALENVPGALEGVLSVAAADPDGSLASYSDFGPRVDLMAPGGALFVDAPVEGDTPGAIWSTSWVRLQEQPVFAFAAGTSQAAAYASGVAALVRAAAPSLPPEVVAAVMRRASTMPKAGCSQPCGAGLLDAAKAVAYARAIEEAMCGAKGCGGSNELAPVPLRPEEGCSVGFRRAGGSAWPFAIGLAAAVLARRRRRSSSWLVLGAAAFAASCSAPAQDGGTTSSTQSSEPLTVKIVDPIPTYDNGELTIAVGSGRTIEAQVTPASNVSEVDVRIVDPPVTFGRLGHAPYRFFIPAWAAAGEGGKTICVTATDAWAQQGETCFRALP